MCYGIGNSIVRFIYCLLRLNIACSYSIAIELYIHATDNAARCEDSVYGQRPKRSMYAIYSI
jgi:hypothetical protein